ncbi:MAG: type II toxin-antitoxin system VapC family toxin [Coriobacteriales bacterium]|jgi:predicted nucleic acid-binding protein|nr:type II toxin-antitoxin system VapC family toxin [Coriobacteriales bacterium]
MIVLDCSAAVGIVMGTDEGRAFGILLESEADAEIVSSQLFLVEMASAFRKYVKAGLIDRRAALDRMDKATRLVDRFVAVSEHYREAFTEALRLDRSPYDMIYLTLARRNAATLYTLDRNLMRVCEREGVDCVHEIRLDQGGTD